MSPGIPAEFGQIGLGKGFRLFTGAVEMLGAILLLVPATTFWSAVLLFGICLGAFAAQAGPVHGDLIHGVVLLALPLAGLAWLARPPILRGSRLIAAAGEQ